MENPNSQIFRVSDGGKEKPFVLFKYSQNTSSARNFLTEAETRAPDNVSARLSQVARWCDSADLLEECLIFYIKMSFIRPYAVPYSCESWNVCAHLGEITVGTVSAALQLFNYSSPMELSDILVPLLFI